MIYRSLLSSLIYVSMIEAPALAQSNFPVVPVSPNSGTTYTAACGASISGSVISLSALLGNQGAPVTGATYSIQGSTAAHPDCGTTLEFTGSAGTVVTLAQSGTTGFGYGFGVQLVNAETVAITLDITTSSLYPPAAGVTTLTIPPGEGLGVAADNNGNYYLNWWSLGLGGEVPNCTDTGGQHLNYNGTSAAFSCGTSGGSGSASGAFYWIGALNATTTANATHYAFPAGLGAAAASESNILAPAPFAAAMNFTNCATTVAPGGTQSVTMNLRVAGSNAGPVCTVTGTNTLGIVSGSASPTLSVNQLIDVQLIYTSSASTSTPAWGLSY